MTRIVVGAHYGLRDWLAQRVTAGVMAVYTLVIFAVLVAGQPITYAAWSALFTRGWMRVATLLFVASLAWHMWVGVRNILMDYVKRTGLRLALQIGAVLAIAVYVGWTVEILWR